MDSDSSEDPISAFITQMIMSTLETYSRIRRWDSPNLAEEIRDGCQGGQWHSDFSNFKSDDPPTYLEDLRNQISAASAKFRADLKEELKMELSMEIEMLREELAANKAPVKHSLEITPDRLQKYGGMPAFSATSSFAEQTMSREKLPVKGFYPMKIGVPAPGDPDVFPVDDPMKKLMSNPLFMMASRSVDRARAGKALYTPEELIEARKDRFDDDSVKEFMTAAAGYQDEDDSELYDCELVKPPTHYDLAISGGRSRPHLAS